MREQIDLASDDSLISQCKNIFVAHVQRARDQIGEDSQSTKIHGARKSLKRARATLRLLRRAIGNEVYRHNNAALRDVARPLSQARDAEVLSDALDKLMCRFGEPAQCVDVRRVEKFLARERSRVKQSAHLQEQFNALRDALSTIKLRAQRWKLKGHKSSIVFDALRRSYSRVRKARRVALEHRSTDHLHEWRKQTKYFWHQIQVLEPLAPGELGTYADALHRLSDYLGDDHDLAILRATVFDSQSLLADQASSVLKALIDRRRAELQMKAFASAESLLQERPRRWRGQMKRYREVQMQRRRYAVRADAEEAEELLTDRPQRAQRHKSTGSTLH